MLKNDTEVRKIVRELWNGIISRDAGNLLKFSSAEIFKRQKCADTFTRYLCAFFYSIIEHKLLGN